MYSPAWPHGEIKEIFPDIFVVTGTNKTLYQNVELQHSRNMIIIRDGTQLSLINTVRLDDQGLTALDKLGKVENIIRIGAFHGRDDAFYLDHYHGKLWALQGMTHDNAKQTDVLLEPKGPMPFDKCLLFVFETSIHPEGIMHIDRKGGILITCDSIKNWLDRDEYFSLETAKSYEENHLFGPASISNIWLQACQVKASDFLRLKSLRFHHLLSAHGAPLLNDAHEAVEKSIKQTFEG